MSRNEQIKELYDDIDHLGSGTRIQKDGYLIKIQNQTKGEIREYASIELSILQQALSLLDEAGGGEVCFGEYDTPLEQGTGFYTISHDKEAKMKCPFSFAHRQAKGSEIIGNKYINPKLLQEADNGEQK